MTTPEFERAAHAAMARIPGVTKRVVVVNLNVVTASCEIGGRPYELSYAYNPDDASSKERAFAHVLRGCETTRRQAEAGELRRG